MPAFALQLGESARASVDRFVNAPLFTLGRTPVTVVTLGLFVLVIAITFWLARLSHHATTRAFARRSGQMDAGTVAIAARLVGYIVTILGLGVALQTLGLDLGALFAAGAFFAVAIGFAMQNVAQNFVSGIILITERTIKPGDVLEVEGRVVRVTRMGLRATVARSRDEEDLIIPNSTLVQNTVTNYTLRDSIYRLKTKVGVSYGSDVAVAITTLREAASGISGRVATHEPRVLLTGFGDSSVDFEVSVWVQDPWGARMMLSELNEAIWWGLKRSRITIPFPQRDVHLIDHSKASADE